MLYSSGNRPGEEPMNIQAPVSRTLIGSVRRFGPHGVLYQVVKVLDDDRAMIRVIETGEETPYSLTKILADPAD
jgi:hypothetical protein